MSHDNQQPKLQYKFKKSEQLLKLFRLYQPSRKLEREDQKIIQKYRSKSVITILQSCLDIEGKVVAEQKLAKRMIEKKSKSYQIFQQNQPKQQKRHRQIQSFTNLLSKNLQNVKECNLPFANIKQVNQFAKNNKNLRSGLHSYKKQTSKINKIIRSDKISDEAKFSYLKERNEQMKSMIQAEKKLIYFQYLKCSKQAKKQSLDKGKKEQFQTKLKQVTKIISKKVFSQ